MKWLMQNKWLAIFLAAILALTVGTWQGDQPDTTALYNLGNGTVVQAPPGASLFRPYTTRSVTLVVAANDASAKSKAGADYVCDGTADNVEIQAALDALPAAGGEVLMLEGSYAIAAQITMSISDTLTGMGEGTIWELGTGLGTDFALKMPAGSDIPDDFYVGNFRINANEENAIQFVDTGQGGTLENMVIFKPYIGIQFADAAGTYTWHEGQDLNNIKITAIANKGIDIQGDNISRGNWRNIDLHVGGWSVSQTTPCYGIYVGTDKKLHLTTISALNIWGDGNDRIYIYSDGDTTDLTINGTNFHPYSGHTNPYVYLAGNSTGGLILNNVNRGFGNGLVNQGTGKIIDSPYYRHIPPQGAYEDFAETFDAAGMRFGGYVVGHKVPSRPYGVVWNGTITLSTNKAVLESTELISVGTLMAEGVWEIDFEYVTEPTDGVFTIDLAKAYTGSESWEIRHKADTDQIAVRYHDGDAWNTYVNYVAQTADVGNHTVKLTRNSSGDIELWYDGVSKGTSAGTGFTTFPAYFMIYNDALDCDVYIHKLDLRNPEETLESGEQRVATGILHAGAQNSMAFTWQNPHASGLLIDKIVVDVTTASTPASTLDVALDADGTGTGIDFFDGLDLQVTGPHDSEIAGDGGQQTAGVLKLAANGGADDWITGKILDAAGTDLVGKWYIYYTVI